MDRQSCQRAECCICRKYVPEGGEETDRDGSVYCEGCYHKVFFGCDRCGIYYKREHLMYTASDEFICKQCYERHYFRCGICEEVFRNNTAREYEGELLCEPCYRMAELRDIA